MHTAPPPGRGCSATELHPHDFGSRPCGLAPWRDPHTSRSEGVDGKSGVSGQRCRPRRPAWGCDRAAARRAGWTGPRPGRPPDRGRSPCACTPSPSEPVDGRRPRRGEALPQFLCVGDIEVDLVRLTVQCEHDRFRRFSAIDVVGDRDYYALRHGYRSLRARSPRADMR